MTAKDLWIGNSMSKKSIREHITPHKIAIVILIQEYCYMKFGAIHREKNKESEEMFMDIAANMNEPLFRRDFCMLILNLIQCPDMTFTEMISLLNSQKYKLPPALVSRFLVNCYDFKSKEVYAFMDIIMNLGRLLMDSGSFTPHVNKSSPIGVFLRRVMLFFDKLNFSITVNLFRGFKAYVDMARGQIAHFICERYKLCLTPLAPLEPLADSLSPSVAPMSASCSNLAQDSFPMEESSAMRSDDMEMTSMADDVTSSASVGSTLDPVMDNALQDIKGDESTIKETLPPLWSRRQAELFIARQTAWLQNNESLALPAPQLQDIIRQVIKGNPDHFEAHYLSYLNCLRVKEFAGAVDSLYHFFDRNTLNSQDKEAKGYRYASLNLAILHAQFGHKSEALAALKEAIFLSHEANDNVCLQHAQAWLYKLTDKTKEILMEKSISKCSELSLNYLTSLGLQSFAQFAGSTGGKPALVFEVLMRSDVLNCQFSLMDLMAQSFCQKAALWTLYGKADMTSLSSQLLLHLDMAESSQGLHSYNGEATCLAVCNIALRLTELGEYELSILVVDHAKSRFPNSITWQLTEQILYFTRSLYRGEWQAAQTAVRQLATLNKWEALLREGELLLAQGDSARALAAVTVVLDDSPSLCPTVRVRALLLAARGSNTAAISILTAALSIANYHYLDYLTSLVAMQLAHVQLQMNLPNQALKLMDQSLLVVLSHGGYYDQASALLLFVKCKVASVATAQSELRTEVLADAIRLLNKVKENFHHMEAYIKVKEAVYLQCLLANELGCCAERNKLSYEFRQLDEDFPTVLKI